LLDFTTYHPPDKNKIPHKAFVEKSEKSSNIPLFILSKMIHSEHFTPESLAFQSKLLYKTGLGNDTYFPGNLHAILIDLICF
jgi:hypothetical protein